ncbi:hypothetical protein D3C87_1363290 [compost metagenome]
MPIDGLRHRSQIDEVRAGQGTGHGLPEVRPALRPQRSQAFIVGQRGVAAGMRAGKPGEEARAMHPLAVQRQQRDRLAIDRAHHIMLLVERNSAVAHPEADEIVTLAGRLDAGCGEAPPERLHLLDPVRDRRRGAGGGSSGRSQRPVPAFLDLIRGPDDAVRVHDCLCSCPKSAPVSPRGVNRT